jgi:threonine aldolase
MVFVDIPVQRADALRSFLLTRDIRIGSGARVRMVTHLDVAEADVDAVVNAIGEFFAQSSQPRAALQPS